MENIASTSEDKSLTPHRTLGFQVSRELTAEELDDVAGGVTMYTCDYEDKHCVKD